MARFVDGRVEYRKNGLLESSLMGTGGGRDLTASS